MRTMLEWVAFAFGTMLAIATWSSIIGTLIVPRPIDSRISRYSGLFTTRAFAMACRRQRDYVARDRILAWQAPMSLFIRLVVWTLLLYLSYSLMLVPLAHGSLTAAFREAESALFTLGYAAPAGVGNSGLVFVIALSGLVVVALQIGYLPTLYSAFNRREAEVTLLSSRAGSPSWGPELLLRTRYGMSTVDGTVELAELYRNWERWAAEVAESHSTYLTLCWLRSPRPEANWLISLLSVMDAAALQLALSPSHVPQLRARLLIRMGFSCLNSIALAIGLPVVEDADPDAAISLTFEEFVQAVDMLRGVGYQVEVTPEQAWPHFRGWRVNYEATAYALADLVNAPPAMWSGPRRGVLAPVAPHRPKDRTARATSDDDPQTLRGPRQHS